MDIEEKCIAKTREYELRLAREDLEIQIDLFERFEFPLEGVFHITWEASLAGKVKQVLILPIAFILILFLVLLTPLMYIDYTLKKKRRKAHLTKTMQPTQDNKLDVEFPGKKTIYALWAANRPSSGKLKAFHRLDLLYEWVDILYGEGTARRLKLRRRGTKIVQRQVEANAAYYEEENAPHFFFKQPAEILAEQLSQELPFYDGVEKFSVFKTADGFGDPQAT
jgi:hypothetical protein